MQAQMAQFSAAERKKQSNGFDLYGGLFDKRIFGSVKASDGHLDPFPWHTKQSNVGPAHHSMAEGGARTPPIHETHKNSEAKLQPVQDSHKTGDEGFDAQSVKMERPIEFSCSPISESYRLGRKSSDASSCSSCCSISKATSPNTTLGNVKVGSCSNSSSSSHSGELSSGGSSRGGSPTRRSSPSPSSIGNIIGNVNVKLARASSHNSLRNPLGNVKHQPLHPPPVRSQAPSLKSGYSSSSSGELNNATGNVVPMGNVLPTGNILSCGKAVVKPNPNPKYVSGHVVGSGTGHYGHGNIIKGSGVNANIQIGGENMMLKAALSSLDPEEVKNAGNDQYKKGHFAEALVLYERAIALAPGDPLYHSNKSAALAGLGRLTEAAKECQEAIKLHPSYLRAHQRLATLHLRLGDIENAKTHLKLSGQLPDRSDMQKVQTVELHLIQCIEGRKIGNWMTVLRESNAAIVAGADSAQQFFSACAEASLKFHRVDDADAVLKDAPKIEVSTSARFFGIVGRSYVLMVQAQVDMAKGRFENAVANAEKAARMDLYNHEVREVLRKARAVASSRNHGNDLFKASKFSEACKAYGEGLEYAPMNAILLCNRAACRFKLGQWEKAVEDCTTALSILPNYPKALRRRADSNAKLERWEESLRDYEDLRRECPRDIEVAQALFDVQVAMKKSRGEKINNMNFGGKVDVVSSDDQFREAITAPGLAVVHFSSKSCDRCKTISTLFDQLCKRYPSVNFLKVDVQENLFLAKSENVSSVPTIKIYKNGFKVKEIIGSNLQVLENTILQFSL